MKQRDGGFAPSYNVQISTDAAPRIIGGVGVNQLGSEYGQLGPALDKVEANRGRRPEQAGVEGGFTSRETILDRDERGVDLIGSRGDGRGQSAGQMDRRGVDPAFRPQAFPYHPQSDPYTCPAGKVLRYAGKEKRPGVTHHQYRAWGAECAACRFKAKGCPQRAASGRMMVRAEEAPGGRRLPGQDGNRRGEANLPATRGRGGVRQRLAQRQARPATISVAWPAQSFDGGDLGVPELQHSTVDSPPLEEGSGAGDSVRVQGVHASQDSMLNAGCGKETGMPFS